MPSLSGGNKDNFLLTSFFNKGWNFSYTCVLENEKQVFYEETELSGFVRSQSNVSWKLPFVSKPIGRQRIRIEGGRVYNEFGPIHIKEGEPLSRSVKFGKGRGFNEGENGIGSSPRTLQGLGIARREDRAMVEEGTPYQLCPCCIGCGFISYAPEVGDFGPDWLPQELGDMGPTGGREIHIGNEIDTFGSLLYSPRSIEGLQPDDPWWYNLRRHVVQDFEHYRADSSGGCSVPESNQVQVSQPSDPRRNN